MRKHTGQASIAGGKAGRSRQTLSSNTGTFLVHTNIAEYQKRDITACPLKPDPRRCPLVTKRRARMRPTVRAPCLSDSHRPESCGKRISRLDTALTGRRYTDGSVRTCFRPLTSSSVDAVDDLRRLCAHLSRKRWDTIERVQRNRNRSSLTIRGVQRSLDPEQSIADLRVWRRNLSRSHA
jgi:hypothetical protein